MTEGASKKKAATLLISCPDSKGLVAQVTGFIQRHGGNVLGLEQHVDSRDGVFFMRIEWDLDGFGVPTERLNEEFGAELGTPLQMDWRLHFSDEVPRMALFVSKQSHCLYDILARCQSGEWNVELPLIVSNHPNLEPVARNLGIDYHCIPIDRSNKREQEQKQIELLREKNIDFIVLARYMQIVSGEFIDEFPDRIINIHHSFLPAFPGARPYHSAHDRGVKIIGATSHYVTADLDAGPIIEQDVVHVSHSDSVRDLVRKGRDLEKVVLSRAIWLHLNRKLLVWRNRTVVFA
ncbi:MAG: formyltetrahydrofolate deformylase [bacterium]|nr:formyltetrahydrofolate deformylase [bacterium]